jgi:calcineurin-like phosphoesterase family protein
MAQMNIDRRDLLKLIGSGTVAGAFLGVLPEETLSQTRTASQGQEQHSADLSKSAMERAPERLLQSEPVVTLNSEGEAKIEWGTVPPTQGGTIYVGVPNDEIALDWPIYNANQPIVEESARLKHEARVDVRSYANRSAARMLLEGGTLAYRLELFDSRKGSAQFIDRHFSFRVEHDQFRKTPAILEGPFLSQISGDSAVVWWVTDVPTRGEVRLSSGLSMPSEGGMSERHVVRFRGLSANTKYRYQAISTAADGEIRSRSHTLKTAPQEAEFSFVFTCDGRTGGLGGGDAALEGINGISARALAIQMARHSPHLLIFTGDLISGYTTREDDFRAQLRSWKRIYGPLWREVPVYTGMGNHESLIDIFDDGTQVDKEAERSAEAVFASEFVHPMNGPEPERPGLPPYKGNVYSFDYAGCHFTQLNSDYWYSSRPQQHAGNPFGRLLPGQLAWLEKDLMAARAAGARHIFVFVHEPAFPNGGHVQDSLWGGGETEGVKARDAFWRIVTQAGARAVFSGHEHNYSRTLIDSKAPVQRDGAANPEFAKPTWQITQGAAGAPFYPRDFTAPWAKSVKKFVAHTWSYCLVQVRGQRVNLETYSYTGELLDQAELV